MCVTIEELMPEDHFLRDLDRYVSFDFVYDRVAGLYSEIGRGSIDPVVIMKMLLIGYLYGIDSERRLMKEIHVNIAYRWFLGLDLDDPVPDHSTLSQLRRRKFKDSTLFQDIFDEVVRRCMDAGLVDGKLLLSDSTHLRANAGNHLREVVTVADEPSAYMKRLDQLALEEGLIETTEKTSPRAKTKTKEVTTSITDPDCGILNRPGKPGGFHYLSHETVDGGSGIITDVFVTSANEKDSTPHSARIQHQIARFGFETEEIGADSGYDIGEIHSDMLQMGIKTYITKCDHGSQYSEQIFTPAAFQFDQQNDCYICPNGCILKYSTYTKGKGMKKYSASCRDCGNCPIRSMCISGKGKNRSISRPYHQTETNIQQLNNKTARYNEIMRKRQIWCEGNFSHQKANHCLSRAKMWGIENVREQCLLSACALNLIRLVKRLKKDAASLADALFWACGALFLPSCFNAAACAVR
jgi:transposase